MRYIIPFEKIRIKDVPIVGGKNASLGEMIASLSAQGIRVPEGFATTADSYFDFIKENDLHKVISKELSDLHKKKRPLAQVGKAIRSAILKGKFSQKFLEELKESYISLSKHCKMKAADVAVRSSATAEDLPDASFAGQQETYLHVQGIDAVCDCTRKCFASLFTDRAISYREAKKFDHLKIGLSVGIQKMARSDKGGSGVMFTLDPDSGFPEVVVINAAWGLGENVVQGSVNPDEYVVFKPLLDNKNCVPILEKNIGGKEKKLIYSKRKKTQNINTTLKEQRDSVLSTEEILQLARWGKAIEDHYKRPMDIEWAKDGIDGKLYIVQARPETVQSQNKQAPYIRFHLEKKGKVLCEGLSIGEAIVAGKAQVIRSVKEIKKFRPGSILITTMTSPDWVPIMKQASGIITDLGGRTSHAAIVSRELGVPAIVGTGNATQRVRTLSDVTLCCSEGEKGYVFEGKVPFKEETVQLNALGKVPVDIMLNIGSPEGAFRFWRLPVKGIGLARMEFIIDNFIKIHPMALVRYPKIKDAKARALIAKLTVGYKDKREYFIELLSHGIGKIAASRYPFPVIVRMSDFKTNEYANLIGGKEFEPKEENPMLGFRGASRYYNPRYEEGFALECAAIKRVREQMGLDNVIVMIPFCRTLEEADKVLDVMARYGLKRHQNGLKVYVMAEIPSNCILAGDFAKRFDGFSIGSNDLTQLVLGIDRDSQELASIFNERSEAVKKMITDLITIAHKQKCKVGICGQAPSDYPEFAEFLLQSGIDSISLNPDSVIPIIQKLSKF